MQHDTDIVISGLGVVSPIGIGGETFWQSLLAGESGIRPMNLFDASALSVRFGGQIPEFDPKLISEHARLVLDTRNLLRETEFHGEVL